MMRSKFSTTMELFSAVLDLETEVERRELLAQAAREIPDLAASVRELLRAHDAAEGGAFFPVSPRWRQDLEATGGGPLEWDGDLEGTRIGNYRLLEKIGEGGMGVVFMAEQEEPVRRKVALKIIKLGMDSKQVVARFEAERQALALMDNPNIAKLLDAGVTETGRSYFVMELVRGVPITKFCDDHKLSLRQRLALFVPVCHAVQHAHQKGVIHRDIKPNNVMVTQNGGHPHPMVIDFGVAKATNQRLTEKTLFTRFAQIVGTPAYMSPEQAEMSMQDVDTRSDVYSLGILLYELLTGTTPFPEERLRSVGLAGIQRIIKEEEPIRPSTMMSQMGVEGHRASAKWGTEEPAKLIRACRGDLDWIVLKTIEKDRRQRYGTASGLAEDVRRFLANEPVTAAAPSAFYKLRKFARRNRVATASSAAVAVSLFCGFGLALWSYAREREAHTTAVASTVEAEIQKTNARVNEERARQHRYAADIRLAQIAIGEDDQGRAMTILESHIPTGGESDMRGWEWRYLWSRIHDDALVSNSERSEAVSSVSTSPDGTMVAVGRSFGTVEILDALSLRRLREIQGQSATGGALVAFSPDGALLATTGTRLEIRIWDVKTWRFLRSLPRPGRISKMRFTPDGKRLAIQTVGESVMQVLSVGSGEVLNRLPLAQGWRAALAVSPDGRRIATATADGGTFVVDAETGESILELDSNQQTMSLAFSPDGSILAAGGENPGLITLWDTATGDLIGELHGHKSWVGGILFGKDGTTLVSVSADQTIRVWDMWSQEAIAVLKGSLDELWVLANLDDGEYVITGSKDGTVSRWRISEPSNQEELKVLANVNHGAVLTGSGSGFFFLDESGNVLLGDWEQPGRTETIQALGSGNRGLAWSAEKGILAALTRDEKEIVFWTREQGIVTTLHPEDDPRPRCMRFARNGDLFVLFFAKKKPVRAWDTKSWDEVEDPVQTWRTVLDSFQRREQNRTGHLSGLEVSPDERLMAVRTLQGRVLWYDLADGNLLVEEACHRAIVMSLAFSSGGKIAASGSNGGRVVLWRTDPPAILDTVRADRYSSPLVALSADGSRLVTGHRRPGRLKVWDVATRRQLLDLPCEPGAEPEAIALGSDGDTILAFTSAGMHVWSPPQLKEIERKTISAENLLF